MKHICDDCGRMRKNPSDLLVAARWAAAWIVQGNTGGMDNAPDEHKAAYRILRDAIAKAELDLRKEINA